jgi:hypothetical protein
MIDRAYSMSSFLYRQDAKIYQGRQVYLIFLASCALLGELGDLNFDFKKAVA